MHDIELIPRDYVVTRAWRVDLRHFATALALLALATIAARGWLESRIRTERPQVAALRQAQTVASARRVALDAVRKDKQTAETRLLALQALRDRAAWPIVFRAIDTAHHPDVWFEELDYAREIRGGVLPAAAAASQPAASGTAASPALLHRFEIVGHALSHAAVTEFMRSLGVQPGIADLRLTDSGMRRHAMVEVVDFRLSGLVDPSAGGSR